MFNTKPELRQSKFCLFLNSFNTFFKLDESYMFNRYVHNIPPQTKSPKSKISIPTQPLRDLEVRNFFTNIIQKLLLNNNQILYNNALSMKEMCAISTKIVNYSAKVTNIVRIYCSAWPDDSGEKRMFFSNLPTRVKPQTAGLKSEEGTADTYTFSLTSYYSFLLKNSGMSFEESTECYSAFENFDTAGRNLIIYRDFQSNCQPHISDRTVQNAFTVDE